MQASCPQFRNFQNYGENNVVKRKWMSKLYCKIVYFCIKLLTKVDIFIIEFEHILHASYFIFYFSVTKKIRNP